MASETVTECDNAGACHSLDIQTIKMSASLSQRQKKYPAAFKALSWQIGYLFRTPTMCLFSTNRQRGSRGRNSLQLVFALTKAFIAKVQELTSVDRQGGDKRGPLEIMAQMHTWCIQSLVDTQMTPWKDKCRWSQATLSVWEISVAAPFRNPDIEYL